MNQYKSWKANQKKNMPKLNWSEIIRLGKKKSNAICPEWLWITVFCVFIIVLGFIMFNFDRIEPGEVRAIKAGEINTEAPKEPLDGKMTATVSIIGVGEYKEGDQEPRFKIAMTGVASWYDYSLDGDVIGNEWSKSHDTCATKGWNRYGKARVTNLDNGKSVECYINDDGPRDCEYRYKYKLDKPGECIERLVDLSSHAFKQIGDLGEGLINVKVEEI